MERWINDDLATMILPAYTGSVDAAIALAERVLPGFRIAIDRRTNGICLAWASDDDDGPAIPSMGANLAIALVIATLKAKESETP